jgi:hypothetical protein
VSSTVEQYVRTARLYGDPQIVFETAREDGLSAIELGTLVSRLRREFDLASAALARARAERKADAATRAKARMKNLSPDGRGRAKFKPDNKNENRRGRGYETDRERLARGLVRHGVPDRTIVAQLACKPQWLRDFRAALDAEAEAVQLLGCNPGEGIGPVGGQLAVGAISPAVYDWMLRVLGHGSGSPKVSRDRLSTSGVTSDFRDGQTLPPDIIAPAMRFGRLTVVEAGRDKTNRKVIVCFCDCGNETTAKPSHLLRGEKRSCGCLRRDRMAAMQKRTEVAR